MSELFDTFISDNYNKIRNIAQNYADMEEYEDLMQEIFVQLWRSHDNFRGESKKETWMYRIAINTSISHQRKKISQRKLNTVPDLGLVEPEEKQGLTHEQILNAFSHTLNKVDRAVFVMYLDGLNASQMEAIIGIKANAIKVRISRMKERFRQQFID